MFSGPVYEKTFQNAYYIPILYSVLSGNTERDSDWITYKTPKTMKKKRSQWHIQSHTHRNSHKENGVDPLPVKISFGLISPPDACHVLKFSSTCSLAAQFLK